MLKAKKGNTEIIVDEFPTSWVPEKVSKTMFTDRCSVDDRPLTEEDWQKARKSVAQYSQMVFEH